MRDVRKCEVLQLVDQLVGLRPTVRPTVLH
jgi:hypothetical protein